MLGSIPGMWIFVGPIGIRVRRLPDRDRTGGSHSRKASSSSGRRMANEIGLGANSNE
jgi:hypothetical protein